jgi:hypothetical protein
MNDYAVIVPMGGTTEIIPDGFGGYHALGDNEMRIAAPSFFTVALSLDRLSIYTQSADEYICPGIPDPAAWRSGLRRFPGFANADARLRTAQARWLDNLRRRCRHRCTSAER